MKRPAELFAIAALLMLTLRELMRTILAFPMMVSLRLRGNFYAFQPEVLTLFIATALCFYSAMYSVWLLPFSSRAATWHFWVTIVGLVVFWISFYLPIFSEPQDRFFIASVTVSFVSGFVLVLAQLIFVGNLAYAVSHLSAVTR
jgi:hypothetical protein